MLKQPVMKSFLYKACPRCHGDLVLDAAEQSLAVERSAEYVCLQCGRPTTVGAVVAAQKPVAVSRAA